MALVRAVQPFLHHRVGPECEVLLSQASWDRDESNKDRNEKVQALTDWHSCWGPSWGELVVSAEFWVTLLAIPQSSLIFFSPAYMQIVYFAVPLRLFHVSLDVGFLFAESRCCCAVGLLLLPSLHHHHRSYDSSIRFHRKKKELAKRAVPSPCLGRSRGLVDGGDWGGKKVVITGRLKRYESSHCSYMAPSQGIPELEEDH